MTLRLVLLSVVGALLSALALAPTSAQAGPDADPAPVELALDVPMAYAGQTVTATFTATQDGVPVAGLTVVFTLTDFATSGTVTSTDTTDEAGRATTDVVLDGPGQVTATATDAAGVVVGTAGPVGFPDEPVCRCSPINASIEARDAQDGDDVVRVVQRRAGADAVVRLFRFRDGRAERIRRSVLGEDGVVKWRVDDHNGRARTRYHATVSATVVSSADRTRTIRVR